MQFRVLGPVEVIDDDGRSIDVGGAQSRSVLAMLLVAGDRIVPVETILDRLWPERQPASAASTLQSYVSRLRRALRSAASSDGPRLVFESGGYRLGVDDDLVDARRFASEADRGRTLLEQGATADAHAVLTAALAQWHGPALQDVADQAWARGVATRLDERRLAAIEDRVRVDLLLGRHDLVVGELHDLVAEHPLREGLSEHLAVALYRSGRQAEALRAIDDLRRRLVDELGVDPSHRIRELETQILDHDPALAAPSSATAGTTAAAAPRPPQPDGPVPVGPAAGNLDAGHPGRGGRHFHGVVSNHLVGREAEWVVLGSALERAAQRVTQWVLLEGEPGIGKSRLLEELSEAANGAGFDVMWGRSYESGASPAFWTWMGTINGLGDVAAQLPPAYQEAIGQLQWSTGPRGRIDQSDAGRYQVYEAIAQLIVQAARRVPLLIALDDLQWADAPSLELIEFLAGYVIGSPVLFIATVRELELGRNDALVHAMADLTRRPTTRRLQLRGLPRDAAESLVAEVLGTTPSPEVVNAIHRRADGNPFFMTELARLYAADPALTEGEVVRRIGVPAGVRDVVHRRLAHLDQPTTEALQVAAVLGPLADVGLLAAALGTSIDDCLDRLEPALAARLLLDDDEVVGAVRFSHGLVAEVLLDDMSALRRARLHLRAADAIEARSSRRADVAEIVAEHLWQAASVASPERVADGLEEAAMVAVGRFALGRADELLERALHLRRTLPAERNDLGAELAVISRLAAVRRARYGFERAAKESDLARVRELATAAGELRPLADLLWTEWSGVVTGGAIAEGRRLVTELVAVTRRTEDPVVIGMAAFALGVQCWHEGRVTEAVEALDRAALNFAAAVELGSDREHLALDDHRALGLGFRWMNHEIAGHPLDFDEYLAMFADATPHQRVVVCVAGAMSQAYGGHWSSALELSATALGLGVDSAFGFFVAALHCQHGGALIGLGRTAAGVAELDEWIERYLDSGARTMIPHYLSWLARGRLVLGDVDGAAVALRRAETVMAETGEWLNRPFLLAAAAALASARGTDRAEVDTLLAEAVEVATGQGAHGIAARLVSELRALGLLDA